VLGEQLNGFRASGFSVGWVTTPIAYAMLLTIIILLLTGGREKEDTQPNQGIEDLNAEHAKEIKRLSDRIEELERDKIDLEATIVNSRRTNDETQKALVRAQESATTHSIRANMRDNDLAKYQWLHNIADAQAKDISSYVKVEKVYFCYQELQTPMLKTVFGIDYRNKSVFNITIEKTVSGYIEFEGTRLDATPLIISDQITGIGGTGTITLEQRLTRPEADLIASKDLKYAEFDLTKLAITIKGENFTSSEPPCLEIPKRLYTDPQAEIALLKSEIAAHIENQKEELARIDKVRQAAEIQLWERVEIVDRLSKVMGYGEAIYEKGKELNLTYPKHDIDEWGKLLWKNLALCYGKSDIEKFYSHIDPKCPGYERGAVRVIQVPESNEDRQLWLFYHLYRLSELIREQHHSPLAVRSGENQT
jgi:hypothetical protein